MKLIKMNEQQLLEYLERRDMEWEDHSNYFRECSCCEKYVEVDNINSEKVFNGKLYYDVCDECEERMVRN